MSYKTKITLPTCRTILFIVLLTGAFSCTEIVDIDISDKRVELVTPPDSTLSLNSTIGFKWSEIPEADNYRFQIASPSFQTPIQWLLDTTLSITNLLVSLPPGYYEWRVKGMNFSFETSFSKQSFAILKSSDISQEIVTLLLPKNGDINNLNVINFSWRSVAEASHYSFRLSFQQSVLFTEETNQTFFSASPEMGDGLYTWEVKAANDQYSTVYFSHTFISDTTPPGGRSLISPAHESIIADTSVTFSWNRSGLAFSNEADSLLIYLDSLLTKRYKSLITLSTSQTVILENRIYYWTVRGYDEAGNCGIIADTFKLTINKEKL